VWVGGAGRHGPCCFMGSRVDSRAAFQILVPTGGNLVIVMRLSNIIVSPAIMVNALDDLTHPCILGIQIF
jgi:hypothetical protein